MAMKKGTKTDTKQGNKQATSNGTQRKERLQVVVDLLTWDVEPELRYSRAGNAVTKLHISKDNAYKYTATAFGDFAEKLANGKFEAPTLILTVEYDKDREGKITGIGLFAREEEQLPF